MDEIVTLLVYFVIGVAIGYFFLTFLNGLKKVHILRTIIKYLNSGMIDYLSKR